MTNRYIRRHVKWGCAKSELAHLIFKTNSAKPHKEFESSYGMMVNWRGLVRFFPRHITLCRS